MSVKSKILKALLAAGVGAAGAVTGGAAWTALPTILAAGTGAGTSLLGGTGEAIGKATSAAGQNRLEQERLALQANNQNISGKSAFERALLARAELEDRQRLRAQKDAYRASVASNPVSSPYNPRPQTLSPEFLAAMRNVGTTASNRIAAPDRYGVSGLPELAPYTPLDIKNLQTSTGTEKGKLEKFGDWAGPISSIVSRLMKRRASDYMPTSGIDTTGYGDYGTEDWMHH